MKFLKISTRGIYCPVDIKPNQKCSDISLGLSGLIVHVKAPATENKANTELIKLLKTHKVSVEIVRGHKGKSKVIFAENSNGKALIDFIDSLNIKS